jgi:hypothetical protein
MGHHHQHHLLLLGCLSLQPTLSGRQLLSLQILSSSKGWHQVLQLWQRRQLVCSCKRVALQARSRCQELQAAAPQLQLLGRQVAVKVRVIRTCVLSACQSLVR